MYHRTSTRHVLDAEYFYPCSCRLRNSGELVHWSHITVKEPNNHISELKDLSMQSPEQGQQWPSWDSVAVWPRNLTKCISYGSEGFHNEDIS